MGDVTQSLVAMRAEDSRAAEDLLSLVYGELRRIAAVKMAGEAVGHTLQPTALVHEAWLKLSTAGAKGFDNRAHFFSCAAEAMRRILVESARRKNSLKRGSGSERVELEEWHLLESPQSDELLAVHEALDRLAVKDPVTAELVKLLYFAGLTMEEAAGAQKLNAIGASTSMRNIPDVAMAADNIWTVYNNGVRDAAEGTSAAAPLWAAFTALVNEQAADAARPPVGFLSPAIYYLGQSSSYTNAFHDIATGSNAWPGNPNQYFAAQGYDLCTGWGTPHGQDMIDALANYSGQIWVNYNASCDGNGSYDSPFCNLALGLNAVRNNGTICLVGPSSTAETGKITNAVTLRAFFGPVTFGRQQP